MANVTKGSITSSYPDSIPSHTVQSEALDPESEDSTLAEGRDANKWSAEIEAIAAALGIGGRGGTTVFELTAVVEILKYIFRGTQYTCAGDATLSLFAGQDNYIYIDMADNDVKVSTSNWPSTPHIRLAKYTSGSVLTDERPDDLRPAAAYEIYGSSSSYTEIDAGKVTIPNGNTSAAVTFNIEFDSAPVITFGHQRPSDATLRKPGATNISTTGFTAHIDVAAPAGGCVVHWTAVGKRNLAGSGSGS